MRWIKAIIPVALAVAGILLTVGANTAVSNGRSWIDLVAGSGVFGFLASPQVRVYIAAAVFFALGFIAKGRVRSWRMKTSTHTAGPSPHDLYSRMDVLVDRIEHYFQTKEWRPSENRVSLSTDCFSFNTTLVKAGYPVPDIHQLDPDSRLGVLGFYYAQVGPYLRDGHITEAKQIAASLSAPGATPTLSTSEGV
jgi:hypothetical protein